MKTCKDCISLDVCAVKKKYYANRPLKNGHIDKEQLKYMKGVEKTCNHFKNKARIVELPNVEIGQALFYIDRLTKTVKSDIVSRLDWEETDLGVETGIWSENNTFSGFFSDVGKTVFLTKEEAEAKLKELNEKCS